MLRPAAFAASLLATPPALAGCPSAADLDGGLIATLDDGLGERTFRRDGGRLLSDNPAAPDGAYRGVYAHPLLLRELGPEAAPTRYAYSADPAELERLAETGRWESEVVATLADGQSMTGQVSIRYIGATDVEIGPCRYPAMQVRERVSFGWFLGGSSVTLTYVPGLGLVTGGAGTGDTATLPPPARVTMIKRR